MIACDSPASFGEQCTGHYFENELMRGLDFCDGSSDVQHSDGTYWHYDKDGGAVRVFDSETPLTDDGKCERITA